MPQQFTGIFFYHEDERLPYSLQEALKAVTKNPELADLFTRVTRAGKETLRDCANRMNIPLHSSTSKVADESHSRESQ